MVGLVIVSHSATLAAGVVELARQMGGEEVAIEAAGGMADPPGEIGTDMELVLKAIQAAAGPDGVLVLMDLGSAVMSAEMAAEMVDDVQVLLCEAPLVEGAVAAAARARTGASLDEVAAEARAALGMKAAQLGVEVACGGSRRRSRRTATSCGSRCSNRLGLHARPAARVVETVSRFDAAVSVADETTGRGPADARSLSALITLAVRQGDTIAVRASGEQAADALAALRELAEAGFGDDDGDAPAAEPAAAPAPAPAVAAPRPGDVLRGVPASSGIAIAPARPQGGSDPLTTAGKEGSDPLTTAGKEGDTASKGGQAPSVPRRSGRGSSTRGRARGRMSRPRARGSPSRPARPRRRSSTRTCCCSTTPPCSGRPSRPSTTGTAPSRPGALPRARPRRPTARSTIPTCRSGPSTSRTSAAACCGTSPARPLRPPSPSRACWWPATSRRVTPRRSTASWSGAWRSPAAAPPRTPRSSPARSGSPPSSASGTPCWRSATAPCWWWTATPARSRSTRRPTTLAERERARAEAEQRHARARERAREPARLRDGETIEVAANVGSLADAEAAAELGADGVGLLRTEFLFLDRDDAPTEDEQRAVYEDIAAALGGRPVIVRTLDAGADKPLRFLPQAPEDNPFLGVRGIRLGLAHPELLRTQLRAIAAVAARHPVKVMFPMVATLDEYRAARALLEAELGGTTIEIGVMLEVPAVALEADAFAREVDFFSVGTNDLTQYTMAAERGNEALAGLLAGAQAPVLRLIAAAVEAARAHGRWVGVCGELAGEPEAAVVLAGLGVRELSMAAGRIPEVKDALRAVTPAEARRAAERALGR